MSDVNVRTIRGPNNELYIKVIDMLYMLHVILNETKMSDEEKVGLRATVLTLTEKFKDEL